MQHGMIHRKALLVNNILVILSIQSVLLRTNIIETNQTVLLDRMFFIHCPGCSQANLRVTHRYQLPTVSALLTV